MRRLAICVAVLCMTGAAFAADEASNQEAAKRDAAEALTLLRLPEGAQRVDENPARDPQYLDSPGMRSPGPNQIFDSQFWRVPGNPWDVFAWLKKHPPAGMRIAGTGGGGNRDGMQVWGVSFQRRPIREVMNARQLSITLAKATGGGTAVRADGLATWIVPRPASEQVPAGADLVQVRIHGVEPTPVVRLDIREGRRIRLVTRMFNRLPVVQPGVSFCPLERAVQINLTFRRRGSELARATTHLGGCGAVALTIGGTPQPDLNGYDVFADLEAAVGRLIDTTPFIYSETPPPPFPVARVAHGKLGGVPFDAVAFDGGTRSGVCVQVFLAGVNRGTGCLVHRRGKRTSTFAAPACYPRAITAVAVLGKNAAKTKIRFDDGKTTTTTLYNLPHPTLTTTTGIGSNGQLVKLKRPTKISLGYRGPFAFGYRTGVHDLASPYALFPQC